MVVRGINQTNGIESYWDEDAIGFAWRRTRGLLSSFDLSFFELRSDHYIAEMLARGCIQIICLCYFTSSLLSFILVHRLIALLSIYCLC